VSLALRYTARSDRGLVRGNNEDSVFAGARLLALADGMGGHAAGEIASYLVIAALAPLDDDEPGSDLTGKLGNAVREGNTAIAAYVEANPELEGMGTTLTAILFANGRIGLAHIGDSRGYLLRDGELAQITKDDTFVQTLVDEGRITAEEAHSHPQRSLIMRALTGHDVEPTLSIREAQVGDRYLLCSDGLSDPVSTETIHEALQIPDVDECAARLIELALRSGGPDNVTVVVADVVDLDYAQTEPIVAGAFSGDDDRPIPPNTAAGRASAINRRPEVTKHILPQISTLIRPTRSRRRIIIAVVLLTLLAVAVLWIGRTVVRTYYYVTADDDRVVSIMRGVPTSILGLPLHEQYLLGCLDDHDELLEISRAQSSDKPGCTLLTLDQLQLPVRQQVANGLPTGTLDDAINQLRSLKDSLLPPCKPASPAVQQPRSPGPSPSAHPAPPATAPGSETQQPPPSTKPPAQQSQPDGDCRETG
jgi:serine/threonine protein phosphatase PrpC